MSEIENKTEQCPEIQFFGANYPDAICIDGNLWDMDSWDDSVNGYTRGGEDPCPSCNKESAIQVMLDNGLGQQEAEEVIKRLTGK